MRRMFSPIWLALVSLILSGATRQEGGHVAVVVSEKSADFDRSVERFQQTLKERGIAPGFRLYSLADLHPKDERAKAVIDEARAAKPRAIYCVGQKATLLLTGEKEIPVLFSHVPDYFAVFLNSAQKDGKFPRLNGVSWGDHARAAEALRAYHEVAPGARTVGVLYSRYNAALVEALREQAGKLDLKLEAEELKDERDAGPAIRALAAKVDVILAPIDPKVAVDEVRVKLLEVATGEGNRPVISLYEPDVRRGAVAALDSDPVSVGTSAAELYAELHDQGFRNAPLIKTGAPGVLRWFNARIGDRLGIAKPRGKGWTVVE